jgi:hypothetical protein
MLPMVDSLTEISRDLIVTSPNEFFNGSLR